MKRRLGTKGAVLAVIALAAVAVAGGAVAAIVTHTAAAATQINVTESEYSIGLSAPWAAAGSVTFVVQNTGTVAHQFTVKNKKLKFMKTIPGLIQPGETKSLTVKLKKGTYNIFCKLHVASGMKSAFRVGGKPPSTTGTTTTTTSTTTHTYTYPGY